MLRLFLTLSLLVFFSLPAHADAGKSKNNFPADGIYTGRQKMKYPPSNEGVWYHENKLFVRNGEAILDMSPINVIKGKTWHSASDGGFLTFRARFFIKGGQNFVKMRLFESDYIARRVGQDPYSEIKTYPVSVLRREIEFNGVRYKRQTTETTERERLEKLLDHEPMEETEKQRAEAAKWMQDWLKAHPEWIKDHPAPAKKP